jgi:hypothetical protein
VIDLERFVRRMVAVLEASDPELLRRPIAVVELRERLVPYRAHRAALGLSSAEDYELLVLRLVAEEGDFARTTPSSAAGRAREEVASPNPDLDLVEQLGDATIEFLLDVRAIAEEPEAAPVAPLPPPPPPPSPPSLPPLPPLPPPPPPPPLFEALEPVPEAAPMPAATAACPSCSAPLPSGRVVVFCPFCGVQVGAKRCPGCGTEIERDWRHCITCGKAIDSRPLA